jgi:RNA 2',3'-cyclic 3'-phosphodiesterase
MSNNDVKRLFIALPVDSEMKHRLNKLTSALETRDTHVKWVEEENFHLTLKFLGETRQEKIEEIRKALSELLKDTAGFEIYLKNLTAFPGMTNPKVICVDIISGTEKLARIADSIENSLEKLGFPRENRKFRPHLTLGRLKSPDNCEKLKDKIEKFREFDGGKIQVNEICLMQSNLTRKGPIYTTVEKFVLK